MNYNIIKDKQMRDVSVSKLFLRIYEKNGLFLNNKNREIMMLILMLTK